MSTVPPETIQQRDKRGRVKTLPNPEYYEYIKKQQEMAAQKKLSDKNDPVIKATNVRLDRTTSGIVQGTIATPYKQLNPSQQSLIDKVTIRQDYLKGNIDREAALFRLGLSDKATQEKLAKQTQDFAYTSKKKAESERIKQQTIRDKAASEGLAVGTINEGQANTSSYSQVGKNVQVENFVKAQQTPIKESKTEQTPTQEIQGPIQESKIVTLSLNEKIGGSTTEINQPYGSLDFIYGKPKGVYDDKRYDNLGLAAIAGFSNTLRYSDAVDRQEVPKPQGIEWLNYYASKGLRPIYNIPLSLMGDKTTQPTLVSTIIDVPIDLATKGKTASHDPIGDYVRKDPLGTALELPSEAALWLVGAKATQAGAKVFQRYSPLTGQTKKIPTGADKPETVYRGIAFKDKPVIGVQQGKIVKGYKPEGVAQSFSKVKTESLGRDGIEAGLGSGIEKELIYSKGTLDALVSRGIIPNIAKERALQAKVITQKGVKVTSEVGEFGSKPIEGLTQKQSDAIFKGIVKGQKEKDIDLVHGSAALRPQLGDDIIKKSGDATKLGDVDVTPKGNSLTAKAKKADELIKRFAKTLPLEPGQRLSIKGLHGGETTNRALELSGGRLKEPKKILEVVLKSDDDISKYGIGAGSKVLGERIPFKESVTAKDIPVKLHTADYQLLTNIKQVTAFQKGSNTLLDIYPSSGRSKDIVRAYWNVKAKALFKGDKQLDIEAEKFRKLYPGLDFGKAPKEKVLLFSSKNADQASSLLSKGGISSTFSKATSSLTKSAKPSSKTQSGKSSSISSKYQSSRVLSASSTVNSLVGKSSIVSKQSILSKLNKPSLISKPLTPTSKPITSKPISPTSKPASRSAFKISLTPRTKTMLSNNTKLAAGAIIDIRNTTKTIKGEKKRSYNFLGSTRVSEITGFRTKKSDITVGDKKTARLYSEDIEKTKKKYKKSDKLNALSLKRTSFSLM